MIRDVPAYLGLHVPSFTYPGVAPEGLFPRLVEIATIAEASGFTALSVMDHLHQIPPQGTEDEPMLEAYVTLGALAARTSSLQLLTLVAGITYHNPAHLAKQVTTLDVVSGGRAILGIGAAWFEGEHRAYGFEFPPVGERMRRLERALKLCRAMFDQPEVEGAFNNPRPLHRVPILVGGGGEKRTLRLVAEHADISNVIGDAATFAHKLSVLREHCAAVGRDPATIVKTVHAGIVVIARDDTGVRRRLEEIAGHPPPAYRGLSVEDLRSRLVCGTPDEVAERLAEYREAGADGVTFSLRGVADLEPVELAAQAARSVFP